MFGRLYPMLEERARSESPLRVGLIGAGAFGTMLLAQLARLPAVEVAGVADRDPARARAALNRAGLSAGPAVTAEAAGLFELDGLDIVVEATGSPSAGVRHALWAIESGSHVVMVTVEADALVGPLLAERAREAGVVYGLAYGDQPALICELVDWARLSGFDVVCAGKGTKYLPSFPAVTPERVWEEYGLTEEQVEAGGFNPRMFTSFLDGTKSAIEMASVCNATGLVPQRDGLRFPPCGSTDLAAICIPQSAGGVLSRSGTVEVVSSVDRDGATVDNDLRFGVFVTFEAPSDYVARCFGAYGIATDPSGHYAALFRPYHLIGLEAPVSVLAATLLGEATGSPNGFRGDVVAVAKRDLSAGDVLDGEGGATVYGRLATVEASLSAHSLPVGLAHDVRLKNAVAAGQMLRVADLVSPPAGEAATLRSELERRLGAAYSD